MRTGSTVHVIASLAYPFDKAKRRDLSWEMADET
jgi:hypothetical protein